MNNDLFPFLLLGAQLVCVALLAYKYRKLELKLANVLENCRHSKINKIIEQQRSSHE